MSLGSGFRVQEHVPASSTARVARSCAGRWPSTGLRPGSGGIIWGQKRTGQQRGQGGQDPLRQALAHLGGVVQVQQVDHLHEALRVPAAAARTSARRGPSAGRGSTACTKHSLLQQHMCHPTRLKEAEHPHDALGLPAAAAGASARRCSAACRQHRAWLQRVPVSQPEQGQQRAQCARCLPAAAVAAGMPAIRGPAACPKHTSRRPPAAEAGATAREGSESCRERPAHPGRQFACRQPP